MPRPLGIAGGMNAEFPAGSLPEGLAARIETHYAARPFSIFWETRAFLALGVMSLSTGLGILIYKNIDTIGHQVILAAIALGALACFTYCFRRAAPFTWVKGPMESPGVDYPLWLGALLLGTFAGYLQARYAVFGGHTALAVAAPALAYLALAYRFDHRGVLQLGVSGICAAAGVAASPSLALRGAFMDAGIPIATGFALAALWGFFAFLSARRGLKQHFAFSYSNYAVHLAMIAALSGMGTARGWSEWPCFLLAAGGAAGLWRYARRIHSPYFLLVAAVYGYIAVTVMLGRHFANAGWAAAEFFMLYFLVSCGATIWLFLNLKGLAGKDDAGL